MADIVFDTADKKDIPDLIRLRIAYMIDDFGSITEYEEKCMREQLPDYFERKLGSELIAFVARDGGRPIAAAYLCIMEKPASPLLPNGFDGEVLSVYTEPEYRGRGICTQLMKNLADYGREHRLSRIDLMATDEGYPIYKKVGFSDKVQKYRDMRLDIVK